MYSSITLLTILTKLDIICTVKTWKPKDIKALRGRLGLSQTAFAERIGITGNYVHLLEKGVKEPSKTLRLLLDCITTKSNQGG